MPHLEIYIADLWPSQLNEEPISFDLDFVEDRKRDILLGDKTDVYTLRYMCHNGDLVVELREK